MKKRIALITLAVCLVTAPLWAGQLQDKIKGVIAKSAAAPPAGCTGTYGNSSTSEAGYFGTANTTTILYSITVD